MTENTYISLSVFKKTLKANIISTDFVPRYLVAILDISIDIHAVFKSDQY